MTEPLTIFGKELKKRQSTKEPYYACWIGGIQFSVVVDGGKFFGNANGGLMKPFESREQVIEYLESEGRRIAREMLMMAGEMVVEEKRDVGLDGYTVITMTEKRPVVFKES